MKPQDSMEVNYMFNANNERKREKRIVTPENNPYTINYQNSQNSNKNKNSNKSY